MKDKNYLIVEEGKGPSTDNSYVQITQKKMDELKLEKSETVILKGRKRKQDWTKYLEIILESKKEIL